MGRKMGYVFIVQNISQLQKPANPHHTKYQTNQPAKSLTNDGKLDSNKHTSATEKQSFISPFSNGVAHKQQAIREGESF